MSKERGSFETRGNDIEFLERSWGWYVKNGLRGVLLENLDSETLAKISCVFYYGAHRTKEDFSRLPSLLKRTHVFIPEFRNWRRETLEELRAVSQGEMSYLDPQLEILRRALFNSRKTIAILDLPDEHPLNRKFFMFIFKFNVFFGSPFKSESFESRLKGYRRLLLEEASLHRSREAYMCLRFGKEIYDLITDNPSLASKNEIRILFFLGAAHTGVFHAFKRSGLRTEAVLDRDLSFGFSNEAFRKSMFGDELDDEIIAKALLENLLDWLFQDDLFKVSDKTDKRVVCWRRLASKFSFVEIKAIFDNLGSYSNLPKHGHELRLLFQREFERKGIVLPRSEQELDRFLARGF